jgi:hypothetical protein
MKKLSKQQLLFIKLDDQSIKKMFDLVQMFKQPFMKGWELRGEHVTLHFGILEDFELEWINTEVKMEVWNIGFSDKAIAASVIIKSPKNIKSKNKIPHVTLAFDKKTGKGGFESNNITHWIPSPPTKIKGVVKMGHDLIDRSKKLY